MDISESVESYRSLIAPVAPALAGASLEILSEGWDSVAVVAGNRLFKFPRKPAAETRLRREASLLELVRSHVDLPVPSLTLHEHPRLFSEHEMIPGRHLLAA